MESLLTGLVELVIWLAMRITVIEYILLPVAESHITRLNVATVACQHHVDRLKCRLHGHALRQLRLHQRPNFLRAQRSRYASGEAHASKKAIEHKGIWLTHIGLIIDDIALMMRKRRTASMHEQVTSE